MNDKQLQALIAVNQFGTFKKAAENLYFESPGEEYITPESIQYRLKQLEQELGVTLYRKRQGSAQVTLTREGQLFLKEAIEIYHRIREWRNLLLESPQGSLSIASTQAVMLNRLPETILEYHRLFPDVRVTLVCAGAPEMELMVARGSIDLALSTRPPENSDLDYLPWKKSELVLVTPKGHPLTKLKAATIQEVAKYPIIMLANQLRGDREIVDEAFRRAGIRTPNIVLEASDSAVILNYVELGIGIAIVSETNLIRSRRKVDQVPLEVPLGRSEVGLLVREGQYLPSRVSEFLKVLDPIFEPWLKEREDRISNRGSARRRKSGSRQKDGDG